MEVSPSQSPRIIRGFEPAEGTRNTVASPPPATPLTRSLDFRDDVFHEAHPPLDPSSSFPLREAGQVLETSQPLHLRAPVPEPVVRIPTAKMVLTDHELVRHDFPETRALDDAGVESWLLEHVGYLAKSQADAAGVNPDVETAGPVRTDIASRPASYGRALVFDVPGGIIDGKGFGAKNPRLGDHSNGLGSLSEMVREFMYHKLVARVLTHAESPVKTVGSYGVVDWGFNAHGNASDPDGTIRAAAVLRQGHDRAKASPEMYRIYSGDLGIPADPADAFAVEQTLRKYGITSAGVYRDQRPYDMINVQMTGDLGHVLDFGGFRVLDQFPPRPVASWLGKLTHLDASHAAELQPDPSVAIPPELWGVPEKTGAHADQVWIDAQALMGKYQKGEATVEQVQEFARSRLEAAAGVTPLPL